MGVAARFRGSGILLLGLVVLITGGVARGLPSPVALTDCRPDLWGTSRVSRPGPYGIGRAEAVQIPSAVDDLPIQLGIVRPEAPPGYRSPVILHAGPYYVGDFAKMNLKECMPFLIRNFVQHGYTVAMMAVRGAGSSGGCADIMGPTERRDLSQAVSWLGTRPWSNGAVGMIGTSYDGSTPWQVAATGNRHLKTIVPIEGANDLFDLIFGQGRNDWRWWGYVPVYWGQYSWVNNNPATNGKAIGPTLGTIACPEEAIALAASAESALTGELDSFGYWAQRSNRHAIETNYRGSVFLVNGLIDWNVAPSNQFPWINKLEQLGVQTKILIGQWPHVDPDEASLPPQTQRLDFADMLLNWFDRWLKDDETVDTGPRVEVQDSSLRWRVSDSWPPNDAELRTLHLNADGSLAERSLPGSRARLLSLDQRARYYYVSDDGLLETIRSPTLPAAVDLLCATCVAFQTPKRRTPLRISGLPRLRLEGLVPTGPGGNVAAFLYSVGQDGRAKLIGLGEVDLRFPTGDGRVGSPVVPGKRMTADFLLQPMEGVVPAGSALFLVLSQGNGYYMPVWPRFPVMLNYGAGMATLELPLVDPPASSYFELAGSR
jgi:putative CocE/NonD family hydrolase